MSSVRMKFARCAADTRSIMLEPALPSNEAERLATLRSYSILDTPPESEFDDIAKLAAQICGTPIGLVSLVDAHRQWFKARHGLETAETPREVSFCAHTILGDEPFVVEDSHVDPRFADNPLVTGDPGVRFYAGAPLKVGRSISVGALCVIDRKPNRLTGEQMEALQILARYVVNQLELRERLTEVQHLVEKSRRVEIELRDATSFQRGILDGASYSIIATDVDGTIRSFNRAAEEMLGYRADEMVGRTTPALIHDPAEVAGRARVLSEELGRTIEPGFDVFVAKARLGIDEEREWTYVRKDGSRFPVLLSVSALRHTDGSILGFLGIASDITERKESERQRQVFQQQLQRSNRELEHFAYVAAHDLQEPLRKIQAFGERLEKSAKDRLGGRERDYLGRMLNAASRMQTLIRDLLAFSRVTTQGRTFEPLDLRHTVEGVVSDLEIRIETAGGRVEIGPLPTVEGDPVQMRQLFQNLIGNAFKFHRDGVPPVVHVTEAPAGHPSRADVPEATVILVEDNGIGFEQKYGERIFQLFQRLHGRQSYEGTGIGLAVCRKIVERHGGSIEACGRPGDGATFTIRLPRAEETEQREAA